MPKNFRFSLVDAFTKTPLGGNPCAVVFNADSLNDEEMLAIAKEMNQSETAFVLTPKSGDIRARYFTPEREIPLAGHPTIATIYAAIELGILKAPNGKTEISLELNEGPIKVGIENENGDFLIRMYQRKPSFHETHDPQTIASLFNLEISDFLPSVPIQTVSTGTKQLMVPMKSIESLKKISMNADAYREYRKKMGFFSPHFFCLGGVTAEGTTFARHLGTPPDTVEDAFTGSATGGMAAYLYKYGLLKNPRFIAEQGHWMGRPGQAFVEVLGPPEDILSVVVAGNAITTIQGTLKI